MLAIIPIEWEGRVNSDSQRQDKVSPSNAADGAYSLRGAVESLDGLEKAGFSHPILVRATSQGLGQRPTCTCPDLSGVRQFEPYCLRHTSLTESGRECDAFTLMRISGHSAITMTMRYVHPQRDAIELAFAKTQLPGLPSVPDGNVGGVVTKTVTVDVGASADTLQVVGAKGGTRTPTVLPARS